MNIDGGFFKLKVDFFYECHDVAHLLFFFASCNIKQKLSIHLKLNDYEQSIQNYTQGGAQS